MLKNLNKISKTPGKFRGQNDLENLICKKFKLYCLEKEISRNVSQMNVLMWLLCSFRWSCYKICRNINPPKFIKSPNCQEKIRRKIAIICQKTLKLSQELLKEKNDKKFTIHCQKVLEVSFFFQKINDFFRRSVQKFLKNPKKKKSKEFFNIHNLKTYLITK